MATASENTKQRERIDRLREQIRDEKRKQAAEIAQSSADAKSEVLDAQEQSLQDELARLRGDSTPTPAPKASTPPAQTAAPADKNKE